MVSSMRIEIDNRNHCKDFIRLNEQWITEHFAIEESDRKLAANPFRIVEDSGHILSLVIDGRVVGVCALLKESNLRYQLARMAVEPGERGKGYGDMLIASALQKAHEKGAESVYLLSNTVLAPAISLYRKYGFNTLSEGTHPLYARCNIVMEYRIPSCN